MKRRALFLSLISLVVCVGAAFGQQKPRVAIIPLNFISVSKSEASVLTELLETGLVKTEIFDVLEQSQVAAILEAQATSLSDCTDEACAIEFGKLLSAEQIVLGSVSRIGGKYVVNAKLIDVTTGRNLKADKVESDSLENLTTEVELLAYKLAGLTYGGGGKEQVAVAFGEIFVETEPDGAEIYLNGVRKGTSPLVIEKVPVGKVTIEARKENLWGQAEVEAKSSSLAEASIELVAVLGRLFIRSSDKNVRVWIDGREMGALGAGLFKDITAGVHSVELRGEGLYWAGDVPVTGDKTETVEAYPQEVGSITWELPAGARAEVQGPAFRKVLYDRGTVGQVPTGSYTVEVTARDRTPYQASFTIRKASQYSIAPRLEYTAEYVAAAAALAKQASLDGLQARLRELDAIAESGSAVSDEDIERARALENDITASGYDFDELLVLAKARTKYLQATKGRQGGEAKLAELVARRDAMEAEIARLEGVAAEKRRRGFVLLGMGGAGAAAAGLLYFLGSRAYADYQSAVYSADAEALGERVKTYKIGCIVSASLGGGLTLLSLFQFGGAAKTASLKESLREVEAEIANLQRSME